MVRKWPAIDILKLYSGTLQGFEDELQYKPQEFRGDDVDANIDASASFKRLKAHTKWNVWLKQCLRNKNLNELVKVRYGLQVGMDDLVRQGLDTQAIHEMFVRWIGSIEKTARQIIKKRTRITHAIATDFLKAHTEKKRMDEDWERFIRGESF